jgi:hypothetical protein
VAAVLSLSKGGVTTPPKQSLEGAPGYLGSWFPRSQNRDLGHPAIDKGAPEGDLLPV